MRHYGLVHHYGWSSKGKDVSVYAFSSRFERDAWVNRGHGICTNGGYREAVKASDPRVRSALARQSKGDPYALLTEENYTESDEYGDYNRRIVVPY